MISFQLKCPHCLNEERFKVYRVEQYRGTSPITLINPSGIARQPINAPQNPVKTYGVADCPRPACAAPVLIWFAIEHPFLFIAQHGQTVPELSYSGPQPRVLGTWPSPPRIDDSEHWPANLREIFREVQEDLKRQRNPARIVSACRSVLEVALAAMNYPKSVGTLQTRIDKARTDGLITVGMADWAKKIKIDGNEAIHELTATREDAEDLANFIRTFLEIAFDLPERIAAMEAHS